MSALKKKSRSKNEQINFEQRKKDHIQFSLDSKTQNLASTHFENIRLRHQALPNFNFSEVSLKTDILGRSFSSPHFISSMTAGHKDSFKINLALASAAAEKNWLMCVGSQRRELTDSAAGSEWSKIRELNTSAQFVSNIGIEEVISTSADQILELPKKLGALGLIVHLNPLQEVFQKSAADFAGSLQALEKLVSKSKCPIVVKEVGFGLSPELMKQLFDLGVTAVDVAGRGGSHWGMIESLRTSKTSLQYKSIAAFADWGQSAVECLVESQELIQSLPSHKQVWASGGIRSGVDTAKCLALGAQAVGIAQPLMKAAVQLTKTKVSKNKTQKTNPLSEIMDQFDFELKTALFCSGVLNCEQILKSAVSNKKVWYETR